MTLEPVHVCPKDLDRPGLGYVNLDFFLFWCCFHSTIVHICISNQHIRTKGRPKIGNQNLLTSVASVVDGNSLRSSLWQLASLDVRRTRCVRVFGGSLRSTFGGLAVLVSLAARFARLSADSMCSSLWRLDSLDFRRTRCARVFGGSLRSTFGGLAVLVSLADRFSRLSADSMCRSRARRLADAMCSCLWWLASLDFRRTRCDRVFDGSLRSTFGGLAVLVSLAARFARLSAGSLPGGCFCF